jgi:pyruvate dehydrogenase complex dehydrogenase (E1) component
MHDGSPANRDPRRPSWMIHHANHLRPNPDGVKVGGHQASSASMAAILSALYFGILGPRTASR